MGSAFTVAKTLTVPCVMKRLIERSQVLRRTMERPLDG